MAEIDNWIKEQLKKGFKKEQIKDGLRKAGYPQNTIDSVDSFARKKNLSYLPYIIVLLVIILVFFILQQFSSPEVIDKEVVLSRVKELSDSYSYPMTIEILDKEKDYKEEYFPYANSVNAKLARIYALLYEKTGDEKYLKLAEDNAEKVLSFCGTTIDSLGLGCEFLGVEMFYANKVLEKNEIRDFLNASYWLLKYKREQMFEKDNCYWLAKKASFFSLLNTLPDKYEIDAGITKEADFALRDAYYLIFGNSYSTFIYDSGYEYLQVNHTRKKYYSSQCTYHYTNSLALSIVNEICSDKESCIKPALILWDVINYKIMEAQPALDFLEASAELYEFSGDENFKESALTIKKFIDLNFIHNFNGEPRLTAEDNNNKIYIPNELDYVYLLYKYDWLDNE